MTPRSPDAKVERFRSLYRSATGFEGRLPTMAFSDDPSTADHLATLVDRGGKTAIISVQAAYQARGEPIPTPGDRAVLVDGTGQPVAVIATTTVEVRRYGNIDEQHAHADGHGDRTLTAWRQAHEELLDNVCADLGLPFDDDLQLVCQRFKTVWQSDQAPM